MKDFWPWLNMILYGEKHVITWLVLGLDMVNPVSIGFRWTREQFLANQKMDFRGPFANEGDERKEAF